MNPFLYPKTKHVRQQTPRQYATYQSFKPALQREFRRRCVYCQMPDSIVNPQLYGVDHYRPKTLFPEWETRYENLFYCCNPCNSRKGDYWPSVAKLRTHFIPNPCDHEMFRHLRFRGATVTRRSNAGAIALRLLDLNDPEVVKKRELVIESIAVFLEKRAELLLLRGQLLCLDRADAKADIQTLQANLEKIRSHLTILCGAEPPPDDLPTHSPV